MVFLNSSQLKKFLGKTMESAVNKAKTLAQEVSNRGKEEKDVFEDDAPAQNTMQLVKVRNFVFLRNDFSHFLSALKYNLRNFI